MNQFQISWVFCHLVIASRSRRVQPWAGRGHSISDATAQQPLQFTGIDGITQDFNKLIVTENKWRPISAFLSTLSPAAAFNPGIGGRHFGRHKHRQPFNSFGEGSNKRSRLVQLLRSDDKVARELDSVPVFGLRVSDEGKLYCDVTNGDLMVYTHLEDATLMQSNLAAIYKEDAVDIMPLALGEVLQQGGLLAGGPVIPKSEEEKRWGNEPQIRIVNGSEHLPEESRPFFMAADDFESPTGVRVKLVASSREKRSATALRPNSTANRQLNRTGAALRLQEVPIFHIGELELNQTANGTLPDVIWPIFFRTEDIDTMWQTLFGEDEPAPTVQATDLASLVDALRLLDKSPAKPLICAPLDALEFLKNRPSREEVARLQKLQQTPSEAGNGVLPEDIRSKLQGSP